MDFQEGFLQVIGQHSCVFSFARAFFSEPGSGSVIFENFYFDAQHSWWNCVDRLAVSGYFPSFFACLCFLAFGFCFSYSDLLFIYFYIHTCGFCLFWVESREFTLVDPDF